MDFMDRREFLTAAGVSGVTSLVGAIAPQQRPASTPANDRAYWVDVLRRLADPILTNLANGTLKTNMPVEQAAGANRQAVSHLEALGRLVAGIAPWLELAEDGSN